MALISSFVNNHVSMVPFAGQSLVQLGKRLNLNRRKIAGCYLSSFYSTSNGLKPLTVVLDMDECLVHSTFLNKTVDHRQTESRPGTVSQTEDNFLLKLSTGELVSVNQRPGLQNFLQKLGHDEELEVAVFTAAQQIYADPVLDVLDPQRTIFTRRFYRQHCDFRKGLYLKDLRAITNNSTRTVLVDNNPVSFIPQPLNGIPVSSFYDDPNDRVLDAVLKLLDDIKDCPDVKPFLQLAFKLDEVLHDHCTLVYGAEHASERGALKSH